MATIAVTDTSFEKEVLQSTLPVIVDFWAPWCPPCRLIAPSLEEISLVLKDKVKITKVNIDENPEIATKLGVMSIPTLFAFKDGEIVSKKTGAAPKNDLLSWVQGMA